MWKYIQAQIYYIYNQVSQTCGNIFKPKPITYTINYHIHVEIYSSHIYNQVSHTCGNIFKPKPITYTINYHIHVEIYSSPNLLHIQSSHTCGNIFKPHIQSSITYMWKYIQAQTYYIYNQLSQTCGNIFKPKPITYTINYHIHVEIYSSPNLLHIQSIITYMWKYIQAQTYYIYNQVSQTCGNIFKPKPITYTINYHIHVEIYSSPNIFKPKPITYTINYHIHVEIYSSPNLLHIQSIITNMWKYIQAQTYYIYNQLSHTCGNIFKPKPITYTINYHKHVEIYSSPNLLHIQSIITYMWKYIQAQTYYIYNQLSQTCGNIFKPNKFGPQHFHITDKTKKSRQHQLVNNTPSSFIPIQQIIHHHH